MRLVELMAVMDPTAQTGTFVGARLTRDTEDRLLQWMKENNIQNAEPRNRLHVTVVGHKTRQFPWKPRIFNPLEVDPTTMRLDEFPAGEDGKALVLRFHTPELAERHQWALDTYGFEWKHPEYVQHVTLGYNTGIEPGALQAPDFPMFIAREYAQPWGFTAEDRATERRRFTREIYNPVFMTEVDPELTR